MGIGHKIGADGHLCLVINPYSTVIVLVMSVCLSMLGLSRFNSAGVEFELGLESVDNW